MTTLLVEATATFDTLRIVQTVIDAEMGPLGQIADDIASTASQSIVGATRKNTSELTPAERRLFNKTRQLPFKASKPGEPPRTRTGRLPKSIIGAIDTSGPAAIAGPTGGSSVPSTLELGGFTSFLGLRYPVKPRPFMQPALEQVSGRVLSMFEGMLNHR